MNINKIIKIGSTLLSSLVTCDVYSSEEYDGCIRLPNNPIQQQERTYTPSTQDQIVAFQQKLVEQKEQHGQLWLAIGESLHAPHAPSRWIQKPWIFLDTHPRLGKNLQILNRANIHEVFERWPGIKTVPVNLHSEMEALLKENFQSRLGIIGGISALENLFRDIKLDYIVDDVGAVVGPSSRNFDDFIAEPTRIMDRINILYSALKSGGTLVIDPTLLAVDDQELTQEEFDDLILRFNFYYLHPTYALIHLRNPENKNFVTPLYAMPFGYNMLADSAIEYCKNWTPPDITKLIQLKDLKVLRINLQKMIKTYNPTQKEYENYRVKMWNCLDSTTEKCQEEKRRKVVCEKIRANYYTQSLVLVKK